MSCFAPDATPGAHSGADGEGGVGDHARYRTELLHTITGSPGYSLDVHLTCDALVGALVPDFAEWPAADSTYGRGSTPSIAPPRLRGTAKCTCARPSRAGVRARAREMTEEAEILHAIDPQEARPVIVPPLFTSEDLLGVLSMTRPAVTGPSDEKDRKPVQDIARKAALNISDAWRYGHENRVAVEHRVRTRRREQHLAPDAPTPLDGGERLWPVRHRSTDPALGQPIRTHRQDHLGGDGEPSP